jgi:hypothetical protein
MPAVACELGVIPTGMKEALVCIAVLFATGCAVAPEENEINATPSATTVVDLRPVTEAERRRGCSVTLNTCNGEITRFTFQDCTCTPQCDQDPCISSCNKLYQRTCGAQ